MYVISWEGGDDTTIIIKMSQGVIATVQVGDTVLEGLN